MRLNSLSRRVGLGLASGVCIAALVACGGGVCLRRGGRSGHDRTRCHPGRGATVRAVHLAQSGQAHRTRQRHPQRRRGEPRSQGPAATDRLQRHARRRPVPPRRRRHRRHRLVRGPTEGGPVHRPRLLLAASHGRARVREVQHHRRPGGQGSRHGHRVRVGQGDPGASGRDVARLPRRERRLQRPVVRADPGRASWTR